MSQEKIKVGDRVESILDGDTVQGVVKSIYVEVTRGGPAAVFKVAVDRKAGVELENVTEIDSPAHLWQLPGEREACVECGDVHGPQFGSTLLSLFARYQKASDLERSDLLIEIAKSFTADLRDTDLTFPESLHDLATKAQEMSLSLDHVYSRLGRTLVAYLQETTRLKSIKDLPPGVKVMSLQEAAEALRGSGAGAAGGDFSSLVDPFNGKKGSGGGHGSFN